MNKIDRNSYGKYHTAIGSAEIKHAEIEPGIYRSPQFTSFVWNVCDGFHEEFKTADCIFVEPSWLHGYGKFTKGTEADGTTYHDYLEGIKDIINRLNVPTFLLCGKQVCTMLKPDREKEIQFLFHKMSTSVAVFNTKEALPFQNEIELREYVAEKFNCILDFSCGYGILAKHILRQNKKAILTDINTDCIRYLVDKYHLQRM